MSLLMLRQALIGIYWVATRMASVVVWQQVLMLMIWGDIHLLQAGEPGQKETATVN